MPSKLTRKIFIHTSAFLVVLSLSAATAFAQYKTLSPIKNFVEENVNTDPRSVSNYLFSLYRLGIAVAGALALIMIVKGGMEYVTTDSIAGKQNGKATISAALLGLILAVGSWAILATINPALLRFEFVGFVIPFSNPADRTPL